MPHQCQIRPDMLPAIVISPQGRVEFDGANLCNDCRAMFRSLGRYWPGRWQGPHSRVCPAWNLMCNIRLEA